MRPAACMRNRQAAIASEAKTSLSHTTVAQVKKRNDYGAEGLGLLSLKNSGVSPAAVPAAMIATVAGTPRPNSPPAPAAAAPAGAPAAPAPTATPGPITGAAAPCWKHISSVPPVAASVLPIEPFSVVISPVVFFRACRMTQPEPTSALNVPAPNVTS